MLLPASFTQAIADTFYDKTVTRLAKNTTSTDGWVDETATTSVGTFKANVQFNKLGEVQSEMGITDNVDVAITCATTVAIQKGDLFSYGGVNYRAVAVLPFDSHKKIAGAKWA